MIGISFLDALTQAAAAADTAEAAFRREADDRIKALEQERAFAFRCLNLMRSVAGAIIEYLLSPLMRYQHESRGER